MNLRRIISIGSLCVATLAMRAPASAQIPANGRVWKYVLLEGSYLIDDCPACGRPTILQPMRGSFDLLALDNNPLFSRYELRNISFIAGSKTTIAYRVTGGGIYRIGGEVALLQDLTLQVSIDNGFTNKSSFFTNQLESLGRPWPMIETSVDQTNGTLTQVYHLNLVAAPMREIWFSTVSGFTSANLPQPNNRGGRGDLLSSSGRVVKSNPLLLGRLGFIPGTVDLNMDAVDIGPGGEIFFSLDTDMFSETLGQIRNGDLVSNRGRIVHRNPELTQEFGLDLTTGDVGLDAIVIKDDGEILFSLAKDTFSPKLGTTIGHGDLLSTHGRIVKTNQQLLSRFHPAIANHDYGLDALYIWPSGEIWFSTEEGFQDQLLNTVTAGDLLTDQGAIVYRNLELLAAFAPLEDLADFGLDGLFAVTDATPPALSPTISAITIDRGTGNLSVQWDGPGRVFQLERADEVVEPYSPVGPIVPDLTFMDAGVLTNHARSFYRLQQW